MMAASVSNNAALGAAFSCLRPLSLSLALLLGGCDGVGGPNSAPAEAKRGPPLSIGAVQGQAARSPYEGETVSVQGVITGNFVNGLDGFFMQDATGAEDGDRATSDAVFVEFKRGRSAKLRRGDRVSVLGQVAELGRGPQTLTALVKAEVEVIGRGAVSATRLQTAPTRAQDWEALEGMWLRIAAPLTVTSNHTLYRYGELQVAFDGDLRMPTDAHAPGPKARALAEDNARRSLWLDDARSQENPKSIWYLPAPVDNQAPLRAGSRIADVEGILDQRFGQWRLQLTEAIPAIEQAERPPPPVLPEGLRLGSFNVHNLFNGNGRGGGFPTERGASSKAEYQRQLGKVVAMIATLRPDIAALSEIENDPDSPQPALADLLTALNAALGEDGDYQAVTAAAGDDPIRVALIYRASQVSPEATAISLSTGPFAQSRPPLAQTFQLADGSRRLTVVANHFKSKGGCDEVAEQDAGNRDQGDGQGCWNALRTEQARALDAWIKSEPTAPSTPHRVLLGDFNSYTREDPMRLLRSLGWREAISTKQPELRYSYRYNGQQGSLDHALVSPSLSAALLGGSTWRVNSNELGLFDYNLEGRDASLYRPDAYAASDHDPLLIVLDLSRATQ